MTPADLEDGVYRNAGLGVSFEPPVGWIVQELPTPKPGPEVPDLVVFGPENDGLLPVISLDMQFVAGRTLEEHIDSRNSLRSDAIESGELEIGKVYVPVLGGRAALVQDASGVVESQGVRRDIAFREIAAESGGKFYTLTHMSMISEFEANIDLFERVLGTFTMPANADGAPVVSVPRVKGDSKAPDLFVSEDHERGFGLVMGIYGNGLDDDGALIAIKYFHTVGAVTFDIGADGGIGAAPVHAACGPNWQVGNTLAAVAFGNYTDAQEALPRAARRARAFFQGGAWVLASVP